jgi:pyruvate/2-oxoglutarate/acetoin dehydrogenase E1 component
MTFGNPQKVQKNYGEAIREGFEYVLESDPTSFVIGQGLWSPWYVGNSMTDLDKRFGAGRIIDTPVSEGAVTGAALGAAICGKTAIVVHPRMDFAMYAMDQIVNQAAKWRSMFGGGGVSANLTIRMILNRGGEQGAQHSQALHSFFMHVPGLRVVAPSSPTDARDLMIASAQCNDPVIYIDDRWLYDETEVLPPARSCNLSDFKPKTLSVGDDITIVANGYSTKLCKEIIPKLLLKNIGATLFDVRVLSPLYVADIVESVEKTGKLLVVDGGWAPCGFSAEIVASISENLKRNSILIARRVTLPFSPAPTSHKLEQAYYFTEEAILDAAISLHGC